MNKVNIIPKLFQRNIKHTLFIMTVKVLQEESVTGGILKTYRYRAPKLLEKYLRIPNISNSSRQEFGFALISVMSVSQ